jgi:hypothetical protein
MMVAPWDNGYSAQLLCVRVAHNLAPLLTDRLPGPRVEHISALRRPIAHVVEILGAPLKQRGRQRSAVHDKTVHAACTARGRYLHRRRRKQPQAMPSTRGNGSPSAGATG